MKRTYRKTQRKAKKRNHKRRANRTMKKQWGGNTLSRAESPLAVEVRPLKID